MKIIISGDWQLHDNPPLDQVDQKTQRSTRFEETRDTISRILTLGMDKGAQGLLHLGDLTEHKKPSPLELTAAAGLFSQVMDAGGYVWAIAGNHDGSIFSQSSSSLEPLVRMRQDQMKLFHDVTVDLELGMLAIPYVHKATPEQITGLVRQAWLNALEGGLSGAPLPKMFGAAHYGVTGCEVGPKNLVIPGDYLGAEQFLLSSNPLDVIFCGHIHKAQVLQLQGVPCYLPGSPTIQDMGERNDRKTWILFNTETRAVEIFEVPQPRKFLEVPYSSALLKLPEEAPAPWGDDDIVKISGTYKKPAYPKDELEEMFKKGMKRPFAITFDVKAERPERAARSSEISAEGGLRQALQTFLGEKYENRSGEANIVGPAAQAALDLIEEQGLKQYHNQVDPHSMTIKNFMTFAGRAHVFSKGAPVLIVGRNGIGKTNFFEAILWAITGETSKGLSLAAIVRQNADEAQVTLDLVGHDGAGGAAQRYRITRKVKLAKSGKPKQDLDVVRVDEEGRVILRPDRQPDSIADGGIAEVQTKLDAIVGGSYLTLKTSAFMFQNDASPFIRTKPVDRKKVIGEIAGLEPLAKAFKILDAKRLESARALKSAQDRLGGMIAISENMEARLVELREQLVAIALELDARRAETPGLEAALREMQLGENGLKTGAEEIQKELDGLENTAAAVQGAEQELATYKRTQEAALEARRKRWSELNAEIKALEVELAGLAEPDPAKISAAEAGLAELKGHLERAKKANEEAGRAESSAKAQLETLKAAQAQLEQNLASLQAKAKAQPAPVDLVAARAALEQNEKVVADAEERKGGLTAAVSVNASRISNIETELEKLGKEETDLKGKDVGACSKCGQPIDSAHIELEMERIIKEQGVLILESGDAKAKKMLDEKELGEVLLAKMKAAEEVQRLTKLIQGEELAEAGRKSLAEQLEPLDLTVKESAAKVSNHSAQVEQLSQMTKELQAPLKDLADRAAAAEARLSTMKAAAGALAATRGKLDAKKEQHSKNTADAEAEKVETEALTKQMEEQLAKAKEKDIEVQAVAGALRGKLEEKKAAARLFGAEVLVASQKLEAARGAVTLAESKAADAQAGIKSIEDGRRAVDEAKLELGLLDQRVQIDTMAAGLLDPKTGLPVYLIDQALPFLEDRINLYMNALGMERLVVELSTMEGDAETLAVLVDNGRPGPRLDIAAFSGGQLDRIECSIKAAFADLARTTRGTTFGLVCYDEPTGGLDDEGKQGLVRLFHERAATYPVTLIISHDEELIRSFDNRLQFSQGPNDETLVNS